MQELLEILNNLKQAAIRDKAPEETLSKIDQAYKLMQEAISETSTN